MRQQWKREGNLSCEREEVRERHAPSPCSTRQPRPPFHPPLLFFAPLVLRRVNAQQQTSHLPRFRPLLLLDAGGTARSQQAASRDGLICSMRTPRSPSGEERRAGSRTAPRPSRTAPRRRRRPARVVGQGWARGGGWRRGRRVTR